MTNSIITTSNNTLSATYTDADIVAAYLAELDASPKTRDNYRKSLKQFCIWLEAQDLTVFTMTEAAVVAYKEHLVSTHKPATVNAYLVAVKGLYKWTERKRLYPNVAAGIKGQRINQHSAKDALTLNQAARLLSLTGKEEGEGAARDRAILALMLRRGLRTCEVMRANIEDVRTLNGEAVLYVQGKGYTAKDNIVVLCDECLTLINDYLATYRAGAAEDEPLFTGISNHSRGQRLTTRSISRIAKNAMTAAGINSPRLTAHSLRHTAVTFALLAGASVQEVQTMARHSNINTTMIYAHNIERTEAKAEHAVDAYLARAVA